MQAERLVALVVGDELEQPLPQQATELKCGPAAGDCNY
jgi:hypothetical protein